MKQKYYGFDGEQLIYIGEFESFNEASDACEKMEKQGISFFYIGDVNLWKETLERMNKSIQHEFQ